MQGMQKMMRTVKMIVMLEPMLEPLKQKLAGALEHMTPEEQEKAKSILKHITALDACAQVTSQLVAVVVQANQGTEEDREKALATLIVGIKQIQAKVGKHLIAMKQETKAMAAVGASDADATEGASDAPHPKGAVAMGKMTALLVKLGRKIKEEIKDP